MDKISEVSDSFGGGLIKVANSQKLDKTSIYKKPPQYFEISWQTYRIAGFVFFIMSFGVMKYIIDYFKTKIDDNNLINILQIVSFFFIINFGTFLFISIYYKYRKGVKGVNGPKGNSGPRGPQGNSSSCNICKKKTGTFKKEVDKPLMKEKVVEKRVVHEFVKQPKIGWISKTERQARNNIMTPGYLGPGYTTNPLQQEEEAQDSDPINPIKPIIGASASFNENTGQLYSILYFKDANKKHNPSKYRFKPIKLNKKPNVFGIDKRFGTSLEFRAPPNSAVYKVEVVHNSKVIVAIHFYCADIFTGKHVRVIDPISNKKRKYARIGIATNRNDKTLTFESVSALGFFNSTKDYFQGFISDVSAYKNPDDTLGLLGFTGGTIYKRKVKGTG